jgi:RNA polymerase sigma-70 factor (ECF subfamily)
MPARRFPLPRVPHSDRASQRLDAGGDHPTDAQVDSGGVLPLSATETFDGFYRRELPGLVTLAAALCGPAAADDVAQDAMLAAYRQWDAVSRMDAPVAWLRRVCANQSVSARRRRGAEARAMRRLGGGRAPVVAAPEPDGFWMLVRGLPRRQAQVVALTYVYDLSVAEVAATLGVGAGTVKTHLFRARATLSAQLGLPLDKPTRVREVSS